MAGAEYEVVIGHGHQGNSDVGTPEVGHDRLRRCACGEGNGRRLLNGWTVHRRIGERNADLDGIGAGVGESSDVVDPTGGQPASYIRDQQLASAVTLGPKVDL